MDSSDPHPGACAGLEFSGWHIPRMSWAESYCGMPSRRSFLVVAGVPRTKDEADLTHALHSKAVLEDPVELLYLVLSKIVIVEFALGEDYNNMPEGKNRPVMLACYGAVGCGWVRSGAAWCCAMR